MRVDVDMSQCREYANCILESPEVFDMDSADGKLRVLIAEPTPEHHENVRRAAAACPVKAITLTK